MDLASWIRTTQYHSKFPCIEFGQNSNLYVSWKSSDGKAVIDWLNCTSKRACGQLSVHSLLFSRLCEQGFRNVSGECPQGGFPSPLLWILVIDDLSNQLVQLGFQCIGYADDINIIIEGKVFSPLGDLMQHVFSLVKRWRESNEQAINSTKVDLVLFTNRKMYDLRLAHLNGYPVQISKTTKYLWCHF